MEEDLHKLMEHVVDFSGKHGFTIVLPPEEERDGDIGIIIIQVYNKEIHVM